VQRAITSEDIRGWLIARVAIAARCDPAAIDGRELLTSYGLSSIAAVSLTAELEDWLDISLSPLLIWDHPTIDSLVEHLAAQLDERAPRARGYAGHGG
jgi:acyl carrier protein